MLDGELAFVDGRPIPSELHPGVSYRIERVIGTGGFAFACLARRETSEGTAPVVLKIIRPRVLAESGDLALRAVKKEAVALGRLNERVPPTPFVVRLLDTGSVMAVEEGRPIEVPWMALEYVHGGAEGETLAQRVRYAVDKTGVAFEPERAARVLDHLWRGLEEIHAAQVIHRDLKPTNVLCCGFGPDEIFKISDFGIARPTGLASTFGDLTLGTPGYVAPEQLHLRDEIGPWTDVFSLATVMYFVLTGRKYFDVPSAVDGVLAASAQGRSSVLDAPNLSPELGQRRDACAAIDDVLRRATAPDPRQRIASARLFAQQLSPWLSTEASSRRPSARLVGSLLGIRSSPLSDPARPPACSVRQAPLADLVIASLAWDADARCLAATPHGLAFWDGSSWTPLPTHGLPSARFVRRVGPGKWLVGGADGALYRYDRDGVSPVRESRGKPPFVELFDGDVDDLGVAVTRTPEGTLALAALVAGRWLRPLPVPEAAHVSSLARIDEDRWLVVGRGDSGAGFAVQYWPLGWSVERVPASVATPLVASAAQLERRLALAVGSRGHVLRVDDARAEALTLPGNPDLSVAGVDLLGGTWVAGSGAIWLCPRKDEPFAPVWQDRAWTSPFVALFADVGHAVAITVDGGIVEIREGVE